MQIILFQKKTTLFQNELLERLLIQKSSEKFAIFKFPINLVNQYTRGEVTVLNWEFYTLEFYFHFLNSFYLLKPFKKKKNFINSSLPSLVNNNKWKWITGLYRFDLGKMYLVHRYFFSKKKIAVFGTSNRPSVKRKIEILHNYSLHTLTTRRLVLTTKKTSAIGPLRYTKKNSLRKSSLIKKGDLPFCMKAS